MDSKMNIYGKNGQVTIFIIVGAIIVFGILLFFAFRGGLQEEISSVGEENPESLFEFCLNDYVKEGLEFISLRGGYDNKGISKEFAFENEESRNITYLCYNKNSYTSCINQKPTFTEDLKTEIKNQISKDVENCFLEVVDSLESKSYVVNYKYNDFDVEIIPERVIVKTDSELTITKAGKETDYNNLEVSFASRLYETSLTVLEIVNQEARFCYAEISGIMLAYPEFSISLTKTDDLSKIYVVENKKSKEVFRFAVRSCAIPPGL